MTEIDPNLPASSTRSEWSRRTFLKAVGAAAVTTGAGVPELAETAGASHTAPPGDPPAITFPPTQAKTERKEEDPPRLYPPAERVGFALVGLGRLTMGQLLPAFAQTTRCRPVALVTGHRPKGEAVARQYGIEPASVYGYRDFDRIRDNPAVHVVYIVLPNSMHEEFTVRAAAAGKHVLTEKPMATSPAECERMIAACRQAKRQLMVAYRVQYDPRRRMVRRLMDDGRLGDVRHLELYNGQNQGDPSQWRLERSLSGGGALPDIGLYCLNAARFLVGREPLELTASQYSTAGDPRFKEVEEAVNWTMRFPDGVTASCGTSYAVHKSNRYRVNGSEAWAEMSPAFDYHGQRLVVSRKSALDPTAESADEIRLPEVDQFAREMDHMAERVTTGKPPFTPGEEGLQDHRLMAAIYDAAASGRTVRMAAAEGRDPFRGPPPAPGAG